MNNPDEDIEALRALAHPLRLRMLSLLTGSAMSAAEVARELEISHANASYHLKVLHQAGELVLAGEEKIRGGTARRYRYDASRAVAKPHPSSHAEHLLDARATAVELERRLAERVSGPGYSGDLESWVPVEAWHRTLDLLHEAILALHEAALPARTPGTMHVSATAIAFTMAGGLAGEQVRWRPTDSPDSPGAAGAQEAPGPDDAEEPS